MAFYEKYIICIIVLLKTGDVLGQTCGMLDTPGYTVPHGDIVLPYGDDLNITCNLHQNSTEVKEYGKDASSRLYFTRNHTPLPREMTEIINTTSIRIHIAHHKKAKGDNYYCLFHAPKEDKILCLNVVIVGVPPQDVEDFSCISRNYDNLTCTWTCPENYVRTDYNLTYHLKGRASRFMYNCPVLQKLENGKRSCFWNVSTNPQYRQAHGTFYFRIGMNNTFGSKVNSYTFEHFKHVLPNPPENLTAVATTSSSISLSWVVPSSMVSFSPGLNHRILYQCEYYDKVWQFGGLITNFKKNKTLLYEIGGLKYAHALCDIRVSMRSALADDYDESMWSENATITVRTKSKVPDCPPKTDIGSFEIVNNGLTRDVYVYWQQLREEQRNGQKFTYHVEVENHPEIHHDDFTKAYVRFKNLSAIDYVINIWSVNDEGRSVNKSVVKIPAVRLNEPTNFIKVEHRINNDDLYELSWESPSGQASQITNYTIFWCSNDRDRPYQCAGNLEWVVVPNDTVKYNQTLSRNKIYQFAISANSANSSSGMSWAECTIIPDRNMGKMKNVCINRVGSEFIDVEWKLECSNRIGIITGFIIYYCPIESPIQMNCKRTTERNVTFQGSNLQSGRISGLKPYTTYRLTVGFIINHKTYSQTSEPLYNTTNEAAPASPPLNINVTNVTNSSISLQWQSPAKINGILKYYYIYYNDNEKKIDPDLNETTLTDLMSFENYSIAIKACTVACSALSKSINVVTKKWLPGKIKKPSIQDMDDSYITIMWERPNPARGEINYYQVQIERKQNLDNKTVVPYVNVTAQNYSVDGCASGRRREYFFSVRAVNIIDGEHKGGPWSDVLEFYCTRYTSMIYIFIGFSVIIIAIAMIFVFKRLYLCCKVMRDIDVKLPPGLAPAIERDIVPWSSEKHIEDIDRSSADQELLLNQMTEIHLSGDSSGCSSGHESITSSLESTNHMSPSDSGTEHPRSPSLNEETRKNSLRQRNVSAVRPTINKGYVMPDAVPTTNWATKPPPTPAGNYCVLGVDPSSKSEMEPPYVPIDNTKLQIPFSCDLSPPPYVMTGDFIKTPNPGYVPYSATDTADKNTGYVVAGLTKDLLSPDLLQCDLPKPLSLEEKPLYMKGADAIPNLKGVQFPWQQPPLETTLPKSGYVSVGDAPPPKTISEVAKGYVPHRQFEGKSSKVD